MVFEIGVNLRVTECLDRGDRNYMEDFSKCYFERIDGSIVFGFFAIFDGHGGSEAAAFAKRYLVAEIKKIAGFWSENDDDVLMAIKQGFFNTHQAMWNERDKWAKTVSGFDSTAGTTATVGIVRNRKLYIGHVGDSACVIGHSKLAAARTDLWEPNCLTIEHKPTNVNERKRIEQIGGTLAKKSGVQRVVWNRPKLIQNNKNATVSNTSSKIEGDALTHVEYDQVPFLAVTRSLGDLWSFDKYAGVYHISPEPDVQCISLDSTVHRCIILGSDGLWNVVQNSAAVEIVRVCERETERRVFLDPMVNSNFFYNPAASLVRYAIAQWKRKQVRADNVSAVVVMIDPPGPSMTKRREERRRSNFASLDLPSIFPGGKVPSYESFSKLLSKEFLIECSRWRSANESKDDFEAGDKASNNKKNIDKDSVNDSSIISRRSPITSKNSVSGTKKQNSAEPQLFLRKILTDSMYTPFCQDWVTIPKLWNFLGDYFKMKNLTNDNDIVAYLKKFNQNLVEKIFQIIPWIFTIRSSFSRNPQLHDSLTNIPLFCEFWEELHSRYIKPLERSCSSIQFKNMQNIVVILKPNILALLKQHNFISSTKSEYETKSQINSKPSSKSNRQSNKSSEKSMAENTVSSALNSTMNCSINSASQPRASNCYYAENNAKKPTPLQRSYSEKCVDMNEAIKSARKTSNNTQIIYASTASPGNIEQQYDVFTRLSSDVYSNNGSSNINSRQNAHRSAERQKHVYIQNSTSLMMPYKQQYQFLQNAVNSNNMSNSFITSPSTLASEMRSFKIRRRTTDQFSSPPPTSADVLCSPSPIPKSLLEPDLISQDSSISATTSTIKKHPTNTTYDTARRHKQSIIQFLFKKSQHS